MLGVPFQQIDDEYDGGNTDYREKISLPPGLGSQETESGSLVVDKHQVEKRSQSDGLSIIQGTGSPDFAELIKDKDQDGKIMDGAPERIHHVDNLEGILEKIDELSKENRRIAIFLDDVDRFYTRGGTEGLSPHIRKLIINRRKMRVLLCFATEDENFDFEFGRRMPTCCDYQWMKTDARDWAKHLTEVDIEIDWNNLQESFLEPYGYYMYTSAVDWADKKKDSGWYFDYEGNSSVLRYSKAFDFDQFWRGLENVSSVSVPNYLHSFLSKSTECKDVYEQHKESGNKNDNVRMAVKLKSIGLTDEAIEYLLGIPKTTLRRHADKLGYRWKVGYIESPFRFKRINGNENEDTSR